MFRRNALVAVLLAALSLGLVVPARAADPPGPISQLLLNAVVATGAGTAILDTSGRTVVSFGVTGTFVGVVTFQGSMDNTNWFTLTSCYNVDGSVVAGTVTGTGIFRCNIQGIPVVRANVTTFTSGSFTVNSTAVYASLPLRDVQTATPLVLATTLNPTAITRLNSALSGNFGGKEQTFTGITGLNQTGPVFINGPAPTVACPPTAVRVSVAGSLVVTYAYLTTATCTPATGVYQIVQPNAAPPAKVFVLTLNPVAITRARVLASTAVVALSNDQTFTVTGLDQSMRVFVNGPAPTVACPPLMARVSAGNTLSINYAILTGVTCTPATGTYQIAAY